jgi:hypothetical protein
MPRQRYDPLGSRDPDAGRIDAGIELQGVQHVTAKFFVFHDGSPVGIRDELRGTRVPSRTPDSALFASIFPGQGESVLTIVNGKMGCVLCLAFGGRRVHARQAERVFAPANNSMNGWL